MNISEKGKTFLETTKNTPPTKEKAKEKYSQYVDVLKELDDEDWSRFFKLIGEEIQPIKLANEDKAVADAFLADKAYLLLKEIKKLDKAWWRRYWKVLLKLGSWAVGLPVIGKVIEWILENWDKFDILVFSESQVLDVPVLLGTSELLVLVLVGIWIGGLIELGNRRE